MHLSRYDGAVAKRLLLTLLLIIVFTLVARAEEAAKPPITKETAEEILKELRILDGAIDIWAIEHNKPFDSVATAAEIRQYIKPTARLWKVLGDPNGPTDLLGNSFGPFILSKGAKVTLLHPSTVETFAGVVPQDFWGNYTPKKAIK